MYLRTLRVVPTVVCVCYGCVLETIGPTFCSQKYSFSPFTSSVLYSTLVSLWLGRSLVSTVFED